MTEVHQMSHGGTNLLQLITEFTHDRPLPTSLSTLFSHGVIRDVNSLPLETKALYNTAGDSPVVELSEAASRYDHGVGYEDQRVPVRVQVHLAGHLAAQLLPEAVQLRDPGAQAVVRDTRQELRTGQTNGD